MGKKRIFRQTWRPHAGYWDFVDVVATVDADDAKTVPQSADLTRWWHRPMP
jgi:hypothetical protein